MKKNYEKILPTYICDIQEINNLSKVMFMNNFPHHQFILCTSGTGKICTENNIEQTVSKGDIVFINSLTSFGQNNRLSAKNDSLLFYLFSILYSIVAASARFILLFGSIVLSS